MQEFSRSTAQILHILTNQGPVTSKALQAITGKSQPTISRVLIELSDKIVSLGQGRSTRYAIQKSIHSESGQQPLYWVGASGQVQRAGTVFFLSGGAIHVDGDSFGDTSIGRLPWYLTPLRLEGFLGRQQARHLAEPGWNADPAGWTLEQVLYAALSLYESPGALILGDLSKKPKLPILPKGKKLLSVLDAMAQDIAQSLPAGSSAGGEQPKFLARLLDETQVLVKFSPPRGTPFGNRWGDLLHTEALAADVLNQAGIPAARTKVVESPERTYLLSERFDRIGANGRRHAVSIGAVHDGLVQSSYANWASTADALVRQRRLGVKDRDTIHTLRRFGRLIGNSDMHSGNLSLYVEPDAIQKGLMTLAPVYDMLPMRWRPNTALRDAPDYGSFELDARDLGGPASGIARHYWQRLSKLNAVSRPLRDTASAMTDQIAAQA